jgi:hypothetical protein
MLECTETMLTAYKYNSHMHWPNIFTLVNGNTKGFRKIERGIKRMKFTWRVSILLQHSSSLKSNSANLGSVKKDFGCPLFFEF